MTGAEVTFCVAGLEVLLRSPARDGLDALAGAYHAYPSQGHAPDLVVEIETVPGFARGRSRGPAYPGFERRLASPRTLALWRFDAEGEIALPPPDREGPVHARFRVGDSKNSLEAVVRIGMSVAMPRRGALILHASAAIARGRAWIFAGLSGAGKSTIAALLDSACPAVVKLADELVILAPDHAGGALAHATPFLGTGGLPHGASVPVQGLCFLAQAPRHRRERAGSVRAIRELLKHVLVYVAEPDTAAQVLAVAARAVAAIPCYDLEFARDAGVAEVLGIT